VADEPRPRIEVLREQIALAPVRVIHEHIGLQN
jgi:hypothetical protein